MSIPGGRSRHALGWLRAKSFSQCSEVLLATLHDAAVRSGLTGCSGARLGQRASALGGLVECAHTFLWLWHTGKSKMSWYYQRTGGGRIRLAEVFGKYHWSRSSFVKFFMTTDDEVDRIRSAEPCVPNIGGMDGPGGPPRGSKP